MILWSVKTLAARKQLGFLTDESIRRSPKLETLRRLAPHSTGFCRRIDLFLKFAATVAAL